MAEYEVRAHVLQRVDEEKGYRDDGSPKKINEHYRGDIVDFAGTPDERVEQLIRLGAIGPKPEKEKDEKGGQSSPPAAQKPKEG